MSNYNIKEHTCAICNENFGGRKKYCSKECADEARRIQNRERWRQNNKPRPDVTIECEWCGKEHTVPARTAHQARFCSDDCKDAWWSREVYGHKPQAEWVEVRRERAKERSIRLEKEKKEAYLARLSTKQCEWCGGEFETDILNQVTCSSECRRKRRNRRASIRSDKRINESNLIDADITLERLYEIDNGICYLCGTECSYNDKTITSEGYFIAGETYPSIDHVKPLSKGGKHSWNNVKLAHHRCNTIKSNRITHKERTLV